MSQFYDPEFSGGNTVLNPGESHHCISVMRKREGDVIRIIDGRGNLYVGNISEGNKKGCRVEISESHNFTEFAPDNTLCMAPPKSPDRLEWFVEKACEIGVGTIQFIKTRRSVRDKVNVDRLYKKAVSALKQSENLFMPSIRPVLSPREALGNIPGDVHYYMADSEGSGDIMPKRPPVVIIGPEGGFEPGELDKLTKHPIQKVRFGHSVLRTETAGILAAYWSYNRGNTTQ